MLADIRATDQPFAWLGGHIDQLLATPDARRHYGFSFVEYGRDLDYRTVLYKQTLLPKPEYDLNIVSIQDPANRRSRRHGDQSEEGFESLRRKERELLVLRRQAAFLHGRGNPLPGSLRSSS